MSRFACAVLLALLLGGGRSAADPVQKGYGILTFRAGKPAAAPHPGRFRVLRLAGGKSLSVLPERGEALLAPAAPGLAAEAATAELSRRVAEWAKRHPPARLTVTRQGSRVKLVAEGKAGPAAQPGSGHDALGDLTAFLATLDLTFDAPGALAAFVGGAVGTETDGRSLGIAHRDEATGDLTSTLVLLKEEKGQPAAVLDLRLPRGLSRETIEQRLAERTALFARRTGVRIAVQLDIRADVRVLP